MSNRPHYHDLTHWTPPLASASPRRTIHRASSQLMMSQRKRIRPSLSPYKKVVVDARVANTFCTDLWPWPMTLAFNPRRATVMTHTDAKIKVKGQLAQLVEWKQRRMDGHDRSHYFSRYRDRWILIDGRVLKGRTCSLSPKLAITPGFAACQYSRSSVAMRDVRWPRSYAAITRNRQITNSLVCGFKLFGTARVSALTWRSPINRSVQIRLRIGLLLHHFKAVSAIVDLSVINVWKYTTRIYTGWNGVTESMVTIRSPFCGYNLACMAMYGANRWRCAMLLK